VSHTRRTAVFKFVTLCLCLQAVLLLFFTSPHHIRLEGIVYCNFQLVIFPIYVFCFIPLCILISFYVLHSVSPPPARDPCNPSPCGYNAQCSNGVCTCLPEFQGNPFAGCRPECVLNQECPRDRACIRSKCSDPCPGTCGAQATCVVVNHIPTCSCPEGFSGNPFISCSPVPGKIICILLFIIFIL